MPVSRNWRAQQTAKNRRFSQKIHIGDWYDWTTGGPQEGNEWRKYHVVPRAHPSRPPVYAYFTESKGLEAKGLLDFQGRRGITSVVRWNLRPVIRVDHRFSQKTTRNCRLGSVTFNLQTMACHLKRGPIPITSGDKTTTFTVCTLGVL